MDVNRDKMPARADADATKVQLTSPIAAAVPIVAIAVWATVLTARIPAAFTHALENMFFKKLPPCKKS